MPKIHTELGRKCKGETLLYAFGFFLLLFCEVFALFLLILMFTVKSTLT